MSNKLKSLTEAYRQILASINVTPRSDDLLVQDIDGLQTQVMIDSKPVALPTEAIVNNYSDSIVVFHPLCENVLLGESPVIQEFRSLIMEFLNDYVLQLVDSILSIAVLSSSADDSVINDLTPKQVEFIRCTAGADATTLKNWRSVMRRADTRGSSNRVLTIFLKRGGMYRGSKHKRVANVNFNIMTPIDDGELTLFGAKVRKSDVKLYGRILRAIFDNLDDEDGYSAASDSLTAPYFESLIKSYHNVLRDLNSVAWLMRKPIEQTTGRKMHVNDDFMDAFKDLSAYRDILPTMPLNDGDRNKRREEENAGAADPAPLPTNSISGVTSMANQGNPYYDQSISVETLPQLPVQQPQFNTPPPMQQPQLNPNQSPANTGFPSLQEQLAGVPLGGYPVNQPQTPYPAYMNPYAQQANQMPMQGMNPYAQPQQMNPYAQPQMMNPYAQPQMQQMPPGYGQPMNQMAPQQFGQQMPQQFGQPQTPFGFPSSGNMPPMYR